MQEHLAQCIRRLFGSASVWNQQDLAGSISPTGKNNKE